MNKMDNGKKGRSTSTTEREKNLELTPENLVLQSPHYTDYEESVVVSQQPIVNSRVLPVYTLDWISRSDSYFMPATGLDFLIGVPEILLLQTTDDLTSPSDSKFMVKIPKGETLFLGIENSSAIQKALFCSQRSFNMTLQDPTKQAAVNFIRKGALTNIRTCFCQELIVSLPNNDSVIGRILEDNTLSTVSFKIFDENNKIVYKICSSEKSFLGALKDEVHFSILDPVNRTGGVILHKWDSNYNDFLYHITFPSCDTDLHHKILLIGTALLVVRNSLVYIFSCDADVKEINFINYMNFRSILILRKLGVFVVIKAKLLSTEYINTKPTDTSCIPTPTIAGQVTHI